MSMFDGFRFRGTSSPIHQLDPRVKFIYACIMFVIAILFSQFIPLLVLFFVQIPLVWTARIMKEWMRSMRASAMFAVIIFATNMLSYYFYGGYPSLSWLFERSAAMTLRFIVLIESFSLFFLTTSPDHLGLALEQSGVPYDICFAFTTAVRFVPVLAEEAQTILDAQKSRGLELEKGNFVKRIKNYIPVLIPLIVSAIRRSLELAEAMESRAWGAVEKRTNLYVLTMKKDDYLLILASVLMLGISVYVWLFIPVPSFTQLLSISA